MPPPVLTIGIPRGVHASCLHRGMILARGGQALLGFMRLPKACPEDAAQRIPYYTCIYQLLPTTMSHYEGILSSGHALSHGLR